MLSSVASSVAQLTQLPLAPDDATGGAAPARRKPALGAPASGVVSLGQPAATPGATAAKPSGRATTAKASAGAGASSVGYAKASSASAAKARSSTTTKKAGPVDFLDDPKLSVEQKLLKLLAYLNDKWNKELDAKMKELKQPGSASGSSGSGASGGTSGSSSSGLSGFFKKAVSFASKAVPQLGVTMEALKNPVVRGVLSKVAGPALAAAATAMGQPQLAPLALKFGPDLVDAAASAASSLDDGGSSSSTSGRGGSSGTNPARTTSTSSSKDTATDLGSDRNANLKLMEIQQLLDRQKEMFSLVSNILRTTHETRMALIQNVR